MITLKRTDSDDADFRLLITELDANLREIYDELMNTYDQHNIIEQIGTVVLAYDDAGPVACGCFKTYDAGTVEIKRMFVRKDARGKGISTRILAGLEQWALELGYKKAVLETGEKNTEALGLYHKAGYRQIPNYGPYVNLPTSYCFGKTLI